MFILNLILCNQTSRPPSDQQLSLFSISSLFSLNRESPDAFQRVLGEPSPRRPGHRVHNLRFPQVSLYHFTFTFRTKRHRTLPNVFIHCRPSLLLSRPFQLPSTQRFLRVSLYDFKFTFRTKSLRKPSDMSTVNLALTDLTVSATNGSLGSLFTISLLLSERRVSERRQTCSL